MYTIRQASTRTGVPEASLRAWERRYGVVAPRRSDSGYRLYDDDAIATLATMRSLVESGWSPSLAAEAIVSGAAPAPAVASLAPVTLGPEAASLTSRFLDAASAVDVGAVDAVLDRVFSLGSYETVVDTWLMPALAELGAGWESGRVDVAGEHTVSHVVMRRLAVAFTAAASSLRGPRVVVGLPSGSHHELGAVAFATAARRRGLAVVYVGADLPVASWQRAIRAFPTNAAVLAVPTEGDRESARETVRGLLDVQPGLLVGVGGAGGAELAPGAFTLSSSIPAAARELDEMLA